jgi:hypothetical protein
MLGGIGGETARRYYRQESTLDARASGAEIVSRLHKRLAKNPGDLIAPPVFKDFESALRERLLELVEPLVDPRDLPDVFYAFERVRRWGGNNARKIDPAATTLPLLATATFTRSALALDPNARIESALHREMVFAAHRSLAELPLLGSDWGSDWGSERDRGRSKLSRAIARWRHRELARVAAAGTATTIESGRDRLMASLVRELAPRILDSPSSWFFEIVDRGAFEREIGRGDSRSRDAASQALVAALTVWLAVEGSSP